MIHQPLGGYQGQASDILIHAKETSLVRDKINEILAKHTNKTTDEIMRDTDRDNFMSPEESLDYGLIDSILTTRDSEAAQ